MPVPLNGLAKNFKAIDISTNTGTYLETSSSHSSILTTPLTNYMRPQGLNNSNTSTMSQRTKLVSNSSSSVNSPACASQKNYQHISSGSYSKLKSKFTKDKTIASSTDASSTMTPESISSNSVIDSSSTNFSSIKASFKMLERSESQKYLQIGKNTSSSSNILNKNFNTPSSSSYSPSKTNAPQYLTLPMNRQRSTNSNNNFKALCESAVVVEAPVNDTTPLIVSSNKQHDSNEIETSLSLLSSLSSTTSSMSIIKDSSKKSSSESSSSSSSSSSSYENEPALASVSDKIKKLSGEMILPKSASQQQQEQSRRVSTYSSCSSLAIKQNKINEETNGGTYCNNSLTSASALNSNSSSPSCVSPTNRAQVGLEFFFVITF